MTRRVASSLCLLVLLAAPIAAQAPPNLPADLAGRWRLLLHPPDPTRETVRGELDLRAAAAPGTLRLEADSSPQAHPVAALARPVPESLVVRRDEPDGLELRARWNGQAWVGTAHDRLGARGTFEADRLPDGAEYYAALPAFHLRQLILGPRGEPVSVPAAWWAAARELGANDPAAAWAERHRRAAEAAGIAPADSLAATRWLHGLVTRPLMREAHVRALLQLRRNVPDTLGRARFDALFRRDGRWVVDLHDAAAEWTRIRQPDWTWETSRASLAAAGLVPAAADEAAVLDELASLWALGARDSAAGRTRAEAIRLAAPRDSTLPAVLAAYTVAAQWHAEAVRFLLGHLAPPALLATGFELRPMPADDAAATARLGLRSTLIDACVAPRNVEGEQWFARHGGEGMAGVLGQLAPDYGQAGRVELGGLTFDLSTPSAEMARPASGLAEATSISYDPREPPLFALSRVTDAAGQLAFLAGWRRTGGLVTEGELCFLPDPQPHLRAGFGAVLEGYSAQRAELPLVAAAAALRRVAPARALPAAPEVLGPFLVEAHARQMRPADAGGLLNSILGLGYDWTRVAPLWPDAPEGARPLAIPPARDPVLVPALDFFVESGLPTTTGMRVLPLGRPR